MCKILVVPKITDDTRKNALKFMEKMKPLMSEGNQDGLGYAAIDSEGNLFGERWHTNLASYYKEAEDKVTGELDGLYDNFYYMKTEGDKNSFGTVNLDDITALTMHTRMATSGRVFENTHPFVYPESDTSLIHNGVISNTKDFEFKVSSCDSEAILISYLKSEVNKATSLVQSNIQNMANLLQGYYACGVFSRDGAGNRILDVFKGSTANLYAAYIAQLDTIVYCTSKDNMQMACDRLGFNISKIVQLKDGIGVRYNASGEIVAKYNFKARDRWEYTPQTTPYTATGTTGSTTGNRKKSNGYWPNNRYAPVPTNTPNVYDATNPKPKNISEEELLMMQLPPGIVHLPDYFKA